MKYKALPVLLVFAFAASLAGCVGFYGGGPGGDAANPYGYDSNYGNFAPYHGYGERAEPVPD